VDVPSRAIHSRAASVDDAAELVDERIIIDVPTVGEIHQFLHVIEIVTVVTRISLDFLGPIEESGDPFEVRMFCAVANLVGRAAKVDVGEQGGATFPGSAGASEIIELTEVADTGCLDDTSAPPAATFHVGTCFLAKIRRCCVGAARTVTLFPTARLLALVDILCS